MGTEFQQHEQSRHSQGCCPRLQARGWTFQLAALALALVSLSATGFLMLRWLRGPEGVVGGANGAPVAPKPAAHFQGWPKDDKSALIKPEVVLLLSAEGFGYMQPCGCSSPQFGGLDRRFNFLATLKERGWPVVAVDLGDIADTGQKAGPQTKLKYTYSMKALKALGYLAIGVGRNETRLNLIEVLAEFALNEPKPRVLAYNLQNREKNFPGMVEGWEVSDGKGGEPKVGVISIVGPIIAKEMKDPAVKFDAEEQAIPLALKEIQAKKPEVLVLLYQGTVEEAKALAGKFPQFQVILCLSREDEPPEKPIKVESTLIVNVGHKGRYVGLVGVFKNPKANPPLDLHYQLVRLGPEYETPAGKEKGHAILDLLEEYTREVKKNNLLAHVARTKHLIQLTSGYESSTYVGSEKCKKCHEDSYKVWKASPHAKAFSTLTTVTKPSLRQFDGECVSCHVTGFGIQSGFKNEAETAYLLDNGCENCHGPASIHVKNQIKNQTDSKLNALMNPHRTMPNETEAQKAKRINLLDQSCQKCHDIDNDVHWNIEKWTKQHDWGKIFHQEPGLRK